MAKFEDIILKGIFDSIKKGFYIDIASVNNPWEDFLTKTLYSSGWQGMNIEADNKSYELIMASRPKDNNLNIKIADRNGFVDLKGNENFFENSFSNWNDLEGGKKNWIPCRSLDMILDEYDVRKIDLLKMSINPNDGKNIIEGLLLTELRPSIIAFELLKTNEAPENDDWERMILERGYHLVYCNNSIRFFVVNECCKLRDYFKRKSRLLNDSNYFNRGKAEKIVELNKREETNDCKNKISLKSFLEEKVSFLSDIEMDIVRNDNEKKSKAEELLEEAILEAIGNHYLTRQKF